MSRVRSSSIDLDFRPVSYFRPMRLEAYLLAQVQGTVMKRKLKKLFDEGRHADVLPLLGRDGFDRAERLMLERIHPRFMGGHYLPQREEGEVEIARISIESTTNDVVAVYARKDEAVIRYRVVDEYEGDTLASPSEATSKQPLSLGELANLLLGAWSLVECVQMNFEDDLPGQLGFFDVESEFYPELGAVCRARVEAAFESASKDRDDEEDRPGPYNRR